MKKSTKPINRISMAIAMLFVSLAIHAQRFVNTSLEGAQTVCAITQDSDGMIWLGTDNGLYIREAGIHQGRVPQSSLHCPAHRLRAGNGEQPGRLGYRLLSRGHLLASTQLHHPDPGERGHPLRQAAHRPPLP